jgi:hypothetical protein
MAVSAPASNTSEGLPLVCKRVRNGNNCLASNSGRREVPTDVMASEGQGGFSWERDVWAGTSSGPQPMAMQRAGQAYQYRTHCRVLLLGGGRFNDGYRRREAETFWYDAR